MTLGIAMPPWPNPGMHCGSIPDCTPLVVRDCCSFRPRRVGCTCQCKSCIKARGRDPVGWGSCGEPMGEDWGT